MSESWFVYGGLLNSDIRRYKKIRYQRAVPGKLYGYRAVYTRCVRNCKRSKYHVSAYSDDKMLGMLNLEKARGAVVYGLVMTFTPEQLRRVRAMEPGYEGVRVKVYRPDRSFVWVRTLITQNKRLVRHGLVPNPIYQRLVEPERQRIKEKFAAKRRQQISNG